MRILSLIICLCFLVSGCATMGSTRFKDNPMYYDSDETLIAKFQAGLQASQDYPQLDRFVGNLKGKGESEVRETINTLSEPEKDALKKIVEGEIAKRVYNERVGQRNQQLIWQRVASGLAGGLQGITQGTTATPTSSTYEYTPPVYPNKYGTPEQRDAYYKEEQLKIQREQLKVLQGQTDTLPHISQPSVDTQQMERDAREQGALDALRGIERALEYKHSGTVNIAH